jgi:glycine dehydrogenase subunit 1
VLQYPDFFGRIVDFTQIITDAHQKGALVCMAVNPIALGMLKTPGEMGADIAVGEGQPLGIPLSYGGPYLGFLAARKELVRKLSGRLVGEKVVKMENAAMCYPTAGKLIRRKRQLEYLYQPGTDRLAAFVNMSLLGKNGMHRSAIYVSKCSLEAKKIAGIAGFQVLTPEPFFHEMVVAVPDRLSEHINHHMLNGGFCGYRWKMNIQPAKIVCF